MKTITIFGLIYSQHVSNFVSSIKRHSDFRFLGLNKKADVIHGQAYYKQSQEAFDEIYDLKRNKIHVIDILQRSLKSFVAISKLAKKSDIVQFHFISPFVLPLAMIVKLFSSAKISSFIYGSDFLRAGKVGSWCIARVFSMSDSIVCDSTQVLTELKLRYPQSVDKMCRCYFGSPIIDKLIELEDGKTNRRKVSEKKVLMCGYNDSKGQQHIRVLESLRNVAKDYYWIFPMTYGDKDKTYINSVRTFADKLGIDYVILDSFLSEEQWADYILSTDIFIHMQVSDAFSSSIAEHLLLGHVLINGSWLPYQDLDENDIYYVASDFEHIESNLENVIKNYSSIEDKLNENKEKIVKMKSLDYCSQNYWVPYFETL